MPSLFLLIVWKGDDLVRVGVAHRRRAAADLVLVDRAGVERGHLGRGAGAGLAQLVPKVEPGGNVVGREGRLAFGRVEQLAALVQPMLEALLQRLLSPVPQYLPLSTFEISAAMRAISSQVKFASTDLTPTFSNMPTS